MQLNQAMVMSDREFRAATRKPQPASKRHLKTIKLKSAKYDFEMELPLPNRAKLYKAGFQQAPTTKKRR
jgi:hypothetical protein